MIFPVPAHCPLVYIPPVAIIFITIECPVIQLLQFIPFAHVFPCTDHKIHVPVPLTHEYCKYNIPLFMYPLVIDVQLIPVAHVFPIGHIGNDDHVRIIRYHELLIPSIVPFPVFIVPVFM
ncbi:MAG: hypothetical protein WCL02_05100 [bacterium]